MESTRGWQTCTQRQAVSDRPLIYDSLYGLGAALGGPVGGWVNDTFGWYDCAPFPGFIPR